MNNQDKKTLKETEYSYQRAERRAEPPKKNCGFLTALLAVIAIAAIAIIIMAFAISRGWRLNVSLTNQSQTQSTETSQDIDAQDQPEEQTSNNSQDTGISTQNLASNLVYITEYGTKYHRRDYEYLEKSSPSDLRPELAVQQDYEPCGSCHPVQPEEMTVYITAKGEKFHTSNCEWLTDSAQNIPLGEAQIQGYEACGACKPLGSE